MNVNGFSDLIPDGKDRIQRCQRFLKYHGDLIAADFLHFVIIKIQQIDILKNDPTAGNFTGRDGHQAHDAQGGYRFAATGLSHQTERFFPAHIETDPVHGAGDFILTLKVDFQILHRKQCAIFRVHV